MLKKHQNGKAISTEETLGNARTIAKCNPAPCRINKIILTIAFCLVSLLSYPQAHSAGQLKLVVNLRNAPFSSLALLDYREHQDVIIMGKHIDRFKWEFIIPDSIPAKSENMMTLLVP